MEFAIADLVTRYERGDITRRDFIDQLTLMVAGKVYQGSDAETGPMRTIGVDHVSVQVSDLQRAMDFYTTTFDMKVTSHDTEFNIVRLGTIGTIVSLHEAKTPGRVDHFALKVANFNEARVKAELNAAGHQTGYDIWTGFYVTDPDGMRVQIK